MQLAVIQEKVLTIRGFKVMLDFDLAELYGVETKVLKQSVRRNIDRFPDDFMFELTRNEYHSLRSQIVTLDVRLLHNPMIQNSLKENPEATNCDLRIVSAISILNLEITNCDLKIYLAYGFGGKI